MQTRNEKGALRATPYYRAAWSVVAGDVLLVVWRLAVDFARAIMSFTLMMTVVLLGANLLLKGLPEIAPDAPVLAALFHELGQPKAALGAVGIVACI